MFSKQLIFNLNKALPAVSKRLMGGSSATQLSVNTAKMIDTELAKSAHNYHPIPVVLSRGLGANVWDIDGKVF